MWFSRRRAPRIQDELRFHRDRDVDRHMAAGMSRREAERRVFLEFGNVDAVAEACLDARGRWFDDVTRDLAYALRTLSRSPGFALVAVLSLALGIGANTAIFSLINAVMLRPLPVAAPGELVQIARVRQDIGQAARPGFVPYPAFEALREGLTHVSGAFAQMTSAPAVTIRGEDDFVAADFVSGKYFEVLGLSPAAGRFFGPADDTPSAQALLAVITDAYWDRHFARSPSAIGTSLTIRDRAFTIVGVTPPGFSGAQTGRATDLLLPLALMLNDSQRRSLGFNNFGVIGRLKPGATLDQLNVEVGVLFGAFLEANAPPGPPDRRAELLRQRAAAWPAAGGLNPIRNDIAEPLLILMGLVALILMLACVNLSGLLVARAEARHREVAIRLAIGAGRGRLVRQFLTESLVIAALGGTFGLLAAGWLSRRLFDMFVNGRDVVVSVAPDLRVLAFTAVVSIAVCLVTGLAPARQALRVAMNSSLKESRTRGHGRVGRALVVGQLAISMVLVVGATLFVGTLVKLYAVDPGIDASGLLVVHVRSARSYEPARALLIQQDLVDRLGHLPGVRMASAAQTLPVGGGLWDRSVEVEGREPVPDEPNVGFNVIGPGYFTTLGTPVLEGREFDARETPDSPKVAVVNETFARHYFGGQSAIGRRVTSVGVTYDVVGVVRDAKYQDLREATLRTMYIPWTQRDAEQPSTYAYLARAADDNPMRLAPAIERVVREADAALRVRTAMAYTTLIDRSVSVERIMATVAGVFGALALLIAALGMFGVLAFQVARRTNELGVRMVLGATRGTIVWFVVRDVALMTAAGVTAGALLALLVSGLAQRILFGLTPAEPAVFLVAAAILTIVAGLAAVLPARRAAGVDPLVALRHE